MKTRPKEEPAKPELIRAAGYLRKSTAGEDESGRQRQEKSIPQQKEETIKLAAGKYEVVEWFDDPGKTGTNMRREGFQRMLARAEEQHDFQAILCDNLDRFARADYDEVCEVARQLKRAGVRWVVTAGTRRVRPRAKRQQHCRDYEVRSSRLECP